MTSSTGSTASAFAALWLAALAGCGLARGSDAADCAGCHADVAARFTLESSHSILYDCTFCHTPVARPAGPGHHAVLDCAECHSEASHPLVQQPADRPVWPGCAGCHEPHGSPNLRLVREDVGPSIRVVFTTYEGYAHGGYAELRPGAAPGRGAGTGLCEVCHDTTRTYRRDGEGLAHHAERCTDCHSHAAGFLVTHDR